MITLYQCFVRNECAIRYKNVLIIIISLLQKKGYFIDSFVIIKNHFVFVCGLPAGKGSENIEIPIGQNFMLQREFYPCVFSLQVTITAILAFYQQFSVDIIFGDITPKRPAQISGK